MKKTALFVAIIILVPSLALGFGKNKVQYRGFDWLILKSEHFDIYYYDDEALLAERVAVLSDAAYDSISEYFSHDLSTRVPILIYKSSNEFRQTNVTLELLGEGVGGFTEMYKNRVVIPFTGSYEELRHVIVHELTHVFNFDMLYGGLLESIFTRQYVFALPLWFLEGLTEYVSEYWDAEAEMVMRDAAIHGYYFALYQNVQGYLAYKQGQSVIRYIAQKYGRQKLTDILQNVNTARSIDKALVTSIGVDSQGLTEAWVEHIKKQYWPEIASRTDPEDIGSRLTDHEKDGSFANVMPSISPDGQKIVFLSDKSGYDDMYLMSALDGKVIKRLVKGERSADFQSFHYLRSSFSWSPDGSEIAFVSTRKDRDVIYIISSESGKVKRKIELDFDTVDRPAFSPSGNLLAFVGAEGGRPGIFTYDLDDEHIEALHTGALEYGGFSWSPDGKYIAFSTIAPGKVDSLDVFLRVDPRTKPGRDIYMLRAEDGLTRRITRCPSEDVSPAWSPDGEKLMFVSDRNGTYNLYVHDLADSTTSQLTDILGGIFNPTWSVEGDRLAFGVFGAGGWDVFQLKEPLEALEAKKVLKEHLWTWDAPWVSEGWLAASDSLPEIPGPAEPDSTGVQLAGGYESTPYRLRFSPDWLAGSFQYSSSFGLGGLTRLQVSDVLGNHRIYIASDFFSSFEETDFLGIYYYLARRIDYGGGIFHFKNYYYSDRTTMGTPIGEGKEDQLFSERNFGGLLALSLPIDRFRRIDFDFTAMRIEREIFREDLDYYDVDLPVERRETEDLFIPRLSYVKDNTIWGPTGPVGGTRYLLSVERSIVDVLGSDLSFTTGVMDFRKYLRFTNRTQLAGRLFGATSQGDQPMTFYLGGGYTLRGYEDFEFEGNNVLLASIELRYPFIDRLIMRGPIPLSLGGVRGAFFFDIGGAWSGDLETLRVAHRVEGQEELKDLNASYGFGIRMWLGYFLMKLDFAWATRFNGQVGRRVHFTLGGEF
ncbi:MAG: BamA/TamA family outer membrane protein [Candidatus Eisenbacteria bacterium]